MPHRTNQHGKTSGVDRSTQKKQPEKRGGKPVEQGRERTRMGTEMPGYESIDESRAIEGSRGEHRADPERMSRKQRSGSGGPAEQGEDINEDQARGEGRGVGHASGGALSDDNEGRGASGGAGKTAGSRRRVR